MAVLGMDAPRLRVQRGHAQYSDVAIIVQFLTPPSPPASTCLSIGEAHFDEQREG